jgi:Flp pilus assembly protein TadD
VRPGSSSVIVAVLLVLAICACADGRLPPDQETAAVERSMRRVADAAERGGDYATALAYYQQLHERHPGDAALTIDYARTLRLYGYPGRAARVLEDALAVGVENGALLAELGRTRLAMEDAESAIALLGDALAAGQGDWQTYHALGTAHDRDGNHRTAQQAYTAALALSPENPAVLSNLALSYALDGDLESAIRTLERAVALPGATAHVRQNLALLYGVRGDDGAAARLARQDLPESAVRENLAYYGALRAGRSVPVPSDRRPVDGRSTRPTSAPVGGFRIDLGSDSTAEAAVQRWESLKSNHADVLATANAEIARRPLSDGKSRFTVWGGPFGTWAAADDACRTLRARSTECAVVHP